MQAGSVQLCHSVSVITHLLPNDQFVKPRLARPSQRKKVYQTAKNGK
jgi:hypothetical protein